MTVSKNNPNARKAQIQKMYNGKAVKPVKYIGPFGKYIAASYDNGDLIEDKDSKPLPYREIHSQ